MIKDFLLLKVTDSAQHKNYLYNISQTLFMSGDLV